MSLRRVIATLAAIVAVGVLASVPFLIGEHLRETARNALGGVANGTVVAVEPQGGAFTLIIEFQASSSESPRRFRAPAETIGFLFPRSRQQAGDPVLVAYDPRDPSVAHIFSIRSLWNSMVRRAALALLLILAAVLLFRNPRQAVGAVAPGPSA